MQFVFDSLSKGSSMLGAFRKKSPPLMGLDIGPTSIKLLQLGKHNGQYTVENFALVPFAGDDTQEDATYFAECLTQASKHLMTLADTHTREVAIALTHEKVDSQIVQFDAALDDYELEQQIYYQADNYIADSLDDVILDFTVLGTCAEQPELADILLVAAQRDYVDARVKALQQAGLCTTVIDVDVYAQQRARESLTPHLLQQLEQQQLHDNAESLLTCCGLALRRYIDACY